MPEGKLKSASAQEVRRVSRSNSKERSANGEHTVN